MTAQILSSHIGQALHGSGVRDTVFLAGTGYGAQGLFFAPETVDEIHVESFRDGRIPKERVIEFLSNIEQSSKGDLPVIFHLGYECSVVLDPEAPTHPCPSAKFGPAAWCRRFHGGLPVGDSFQEFADSTLAKIILGRLRENMNDHASGPVPSMGRDPFLLLLGKDAEEEHKARIEACHNMLRLGVLYQANLAHGLVLPQVDFAAGTEFFGKQIEQKTIPAYAAFADLEEFGSLISLSPESFLRFDMKEHVAFASPIKGTRPRGKDAAEDAKLLLSLMDSEKDAAEHVMIVDLLRNDLGKVAVAGGVTVRELMRTLSVENVHHLESVIEAKLRPEVGIAALLEATVPGGSITGAPKSAAVEVIHELEEGPRGPYTGNLGLIWRGKGAASILIRTWIRPDDSEGALHVGGGIVVDSDPQDEWQETIDKAKAFSSIFET
jgi:anthranilate/para-aminobenzoate synthase component I